MNFNSTTGAVLALLLIIAGISGVWYVFVMPGDYTAVSLTQTTNTVPDDATVVPYASLSDAEQQAFRDALQDGDAIATEVPTSQLTSLSRVDAVTLDGATYRVATDAGHHTITIRGIGFLFIFPFIYGGLIGIGGVVNDGGHAYTVITGVWLLVIGAVFLSPWLMYSFPLGSVEPGVTTTPVVGDNVSDTNVIRITSLSEQERTAVYNVIEGGSASTANGSVQAVPELPRRIAENYTYVQSNSEYYALHVIEGYQKYSELFLLSVGTLFGGGIALTGATFIMSSVYEGVTAGIARDS